MALRYAEAALEDPWVRGGARLALQLRVLALSRASGKRAPRRWRVPPWKAAAEWQAPVVEFEATPVVSGVGAGVGIRNKCALTYFFARPLHKPQPRAAKWMAWEG